MALKPGHDRQSCDSDSTMIVTLTVSQLRDVIRGEIAALKESNAKPKLLYTTQEAAELCGVPSTWLASAARTGKVKCRRLGSYVRFTLDDLKEFIEQAGKESERV